jgi:PAN domain
MKLFVFLLVLLSAFCAAFASYDNSHPAIVHGSTIVAATSRSLKYDGGAVATNPLDDSEIDCDSNEDGVQSGTAGSEEDSDNSKGDNDEHEFNSDTESIDGENDDDCPSGQYTLKYLPKQRFAFGNKFMKVRAKNPRACARICSKNPAKCNTFNWNKNKKQCQMFTTKSIARKKVKDAAGVAAYLACAQ